MDSRNLAVNPRRSRPSRPPLGATDEAVTVPTSACSGYEGVAAAVSDGAARRNVRENTGDEAGQFSSFVARSWPD